MCYLDETLYIHEARHVALPCFYSSPELTTQTLALETGFHLFHDLCSHCKFCYILGR